MSYKIAFGLLVLLLASLVYLEANQPERINWFESYSKRDKIPYGSYVLFTELKNHPDINLQEVNLPPYEYLNEETPDATYFFLNNSIYFDDAELDKLLEWVKNGNILFVVANSFSQNLLDTLSLETSTLLVYDDFNQEPLLNFTNPNLRKDSAFHFQRPASIRYFSKVDTLNTKILGYAEYLKGEKRKANNHINFIETALGEGQIILNTFPNAFTNYFLLSENNHEYSESALSYINTSKPLLWDNHYKSGKSVQTSLLYVLFSNKHFKWAYYILLIATLLFVVFEGKRKQRALRIVAPLNNKTYDYTKTIAGMYLDKRDHRSIIQKQIALFLDYIRTEWRLQTNTLNADFYNQVAARSGNTFEDTLTLFKELKRIEQNVNPTKDDVLKVYREIESYKKCS